MCQELPIPRWLRVLLIPAGEPRTKPKALLTACALARGEYLTVYDAEDQPDPLQLQRRPGRSRTPTTSIACLQAKLGYYNRRQNLLTRWFNVEYDDWFDLFLPGLHAIDAPIPLGGTSNHFAHRACESLGVGSAQRHRGRRPRAPASPGSATGPRCSTR